MVLCLPSKFSKKLNTKLLSKGFALKSVLFKLDHKIGKFSLKEMQSEKKSPASLIQFSAKFVKNPISSDSEDSDQLIRTLECLSSAGTKL